MTTTITSLLVTRTSLSLPDLQLIDMSGSYRIGDSLDLDLGTVTFVKEYARSPYLHGAQLVAAHKDIVLGCVLDVDVVGTTQAQIKTAADALVAAFEQFAYTLTVVLDGIARSWTCGPADSRQQYASLSNVYGLVMPVRLVFDRVPVALPPTAPATPTIGTAVPGTSTASVAWTSNGDGGSFLSTSTITPYIAGVAQTPQVLGATSPQTVTGLTNGTAYTFKVALTNGVGTSAQSAASNAVFPGTAPGAPTGPTAAARNVSADLTWVAPGSTGGSPITNYIVTPYVGATAQTPQTFGNVTSATITGLTNGTAYTFKVAAVNAIGTSAQSTATAAVTPQVPTVPGAPTIGTATGDNNGTTAAGYATAHWTAPAFDGAAALTGYTVTCYRASDNAVLSTGSGIPSLFALPFSGLTTGVGVYFKVAATNSVGTGPQSAASNTVTPT